MERVEDYYYELSDAALVAAYRSGDIEAAVALITRHNGTVPTSADIAPTLFWANLLARHDETDEILSPDGGWNWRSRE